MLGMLGSGIIFSVFKGEGAPETDKILDFCRSAVGCVSDNACLSEIGSGDKIQWSAKKLEFGILTYESVS